MINVKQLLRRYQSVFLSLVMAGLLVGCSEGTTSTVDPSTAPTSSEVSAPAPAFGTWEEREAAMKDPDGRLMISAHRGVWSETSPENSIASLEEAYRIGVDIVELDIRTTADGQLILSHDESLKRMTNIEDALLNGTLSVDVWSTKVQDLTLEQIKTLRLKAAEGGNDATLTDYRVLTLREALEYCRGKLYVIPDCQDADINQVLEEVDACDAWDILFYNPGGSTVEDNNARRMIMDVRYGAAPVPTWNMSGDTIDDIILKAKGQLNTALYGELPYCAGISLPCLAWQSAYDGTYNPDILFNDELRAATKGKIRLSAMTLVSWGRAMGREYDCPEMWSKYMDYGFNIIMTDSAHEMAAWRKEKYDVGF